MINGIPTEFDRIYDLIQERKQRWKKSSTTEKYKSASGKAGTTRIGKTRHGHGAGDRKSVV